MVPLCASMCWCSDLSIWPNLTSNNHEKETKMKRHTHTHILWRLFQGEGPKTKINQRAQGSTIIKWRSTQTRNKNLLCQSREVIDKIRQWLWYRWQFCRFYALYLLVWRWAVAQLKQIIHVFINCTHRPCWHTNAASPLPHFPKHNIEITSKNYDGDDNHNIDVAGWFLRAPKLTRSVQKELY